MRLIDADKYCDFLNKYPLEKAQNNFMIFYRDALQHTFECEVEAPELYEQLQYALSRKLKSGYLKGYDAGYQDGILAAKSIIKRAFKSRE